MISTFVIIDIASGQIIDRDRIAYDGPLELCDKKAKNLASGAAKTATNTAAGYGSTAAGTRSTLEPELRREATSPTGFMPEDLNAMLVKGAEATGGAAAGAAGEATERAARSRNIGALPAELGEISRGKGRQLASNALDVQTMNAREKARQRSEGLHGLESLYGTDVGAQLKAEGIVPEDINAMISADKTGWGKNLQSWIGTLSGAATGAAGVKKAFG